MSRSALRHSIRYERLASHGIRRLGGAPRGPVRRRRGLRPGRHQSWGRDSPWRRRPRTHAAERPHGPRAVLRLHVFRRGGDSRAARIAGARERRGPDEGVNPACRFRGPSFDASISNRMDPARTRSQKEPRTMRFMMLVIPKGYEKAEADFVPPADLIAKMTKYNDSLTKAGVLLGLDGLQPPAKGARVSFAGGKTKVTDGPFTEAKEVLGGYWMIQVKSRAEAIEWAKRAPMLDGDIIEVRQVQEISDFPPDVQKAAGR